MEGRVGDKTRRLALAERAESATRRADSASWDDARMNDGLATVEADAPPARRRTADRVPAVLVVVALGLVAAAGLTDARGDGDATRRLASVALVVLVAAGLVATRRRWHDPLGDVATPASERARTGAWGRVPRVLAWTLVLGWLLTSAAVVLTIERSASLGDLESSLRSGDVEEVVVAGGLPDRARAGSGLVELRWTEGRLRYAAEVEQLVGAGRNTPGAFADVEDVVGDVTTYLTRIDPDVEVLTGPRRMPSGFTTDAFGWTVSGWLAWPFLALLLLTLWVVVVAPEPWRATRWAWAWLVLLLAPLGGVAYLLLGGPTGAVRRPPGPPRQRFTGGWAFILAFLVASAFSAD
jgi:hypothetical protein